jgi:hypothetical protein
VPMASPHRLLTFLKFMLATDLYPTGIGLAKIGYIDIYAFVRV